MALQTFTYTSYCSSGSKATRYGVQLEVIENSISTTNNTSNVTINFYLGGAGALGLKTDYTGSSFSNYSCTGIIKVDGTQKVSTTGKKTVNNSTKVLLATWTGDLTHNSDGSLSTPITGEFTGGYSAQASGGTASGTPTFTKIARASTITCSNTNIGSTATVNITRASSSYTHTLTYSFANGTITGTIATKTTSTSPTFTMPTTLYAKIPNEKEITGTITCVTYSGDSQVGTSSCSVKAIVPNTAKPTCASPTITDSDTVSKNTIGLFVVGKSKPIFNMSSCFASSYSATLGRIELSVGGVQVYSGTDTSYTMTTPITATSTSYSIVVYDSRGIASDTKTGIITAYAYNNPVGTIKADRDTSTTTTVNYTYSASITNVNSNNKNAHSIKVEYKLSTASTWTTLVTNTTDYTKEATGSVTGLSDSNSYDFRITVSDSYATGTISSQVGTAFVLLDFKADGTGIAIGKSSSDSNIFDIGMTTRQQGMIRGRKMDGADTAGYMKCFTLTSTGTYQNQPLMFEILQRARHSRVKLQLTSSATKGSVAIGQLYIEGNGNAYAVVSNNVLTFYVQKSESYDRIEILNFEKGEFMDPVEINWSYETVSSLPTGYKTASRRVGNFQYSASSTISSGSSNLATCGGVYTATNAPITNADAGEIKFPNGFMIAWVHKVVTTNVTEWGSVYYSDHDMGNWNTAFTQIFSVVPSIGSSQGSLYWAGQRNFTNTSAGTIRVFRATNANAEIDVYITAYGMWK